MEDAIQLPDALTSLGLSHVPAHMAWKAMALTAWM